MKINKKISEKDRKLLIGFLAFLLVVSSYHFIYRNFSKKTKEIATENALLADTLAELKRKSNREEEYRNGITDMENQIEAILENYPRFITQEKITQFVIELEEVAYMKVSAITFQDAVDTVPEYREASEAKTKKTSTVSDEERLDYFDEEFGIKDQEDKETDNSEATTHNTERETVKPHMDTTVITLSYMTTYEGLKKALDYINKYDDNRTILDLSAAFDSSTGNLTGTITICIYTLNPLGNEYVKPEFKQPTGKKNIFGSFELPVEQ